MAILGETIGSILGETPATLKCSDCGSEMKLSVLRTASEEPLIPEPTDDEVGPDGMTSYIGYFCPCCGPYSRESGYYKTFKEALDALESGKFGR